MDEQHLARVEQEVAHVHLADHLLSWDKKQAREVWDEELHRMVPNVDGRRCQIDGKHGLLQIARNGDALICGVARPTPCDYAEPVSR